MVAPVGTRPSTTSGRQQPTIQTNIDMKKLLLLGALLAGGSLCLESVSVGHGGTYRGPGDTVPPGGGGGGAGGGPAVPGPGGPSEPGPSGPATPGAATPGSPAGVPGGNSAGPTTGGDSLGPDLTLWDFWWGFNKDPYLNLRASIHSDVIATGSDDFFLGRGETEKAKNTLRPSESQIRDIVVPALKKALEKERGNDILTGSLIALAKIGDKTGESGESEFEGIIKNFLKDSNQEVSETAAVALGILANEASVQPLVELMNDDPAARRFLSKSEVPIRTRAFAAYGLGLVGSRTPDNSVRQTIAEHLVNILEAPEFSTYDVKVAAITALGLTPIDSNPELVATEEEAKSNRAHVISREAQLDFLMEYFDEKNQRSNESTRHWFVRAHAPAAIARLMADHLTDPAFKPQREKAIGLMIKGIDKNSKLQNELQQSCVLALGQLGTPTDEKLDKQIFDELKRNVKSGQQQSRRFALISLGQIGGRVVEGGDSDKYRGELLKTMSKGSTTMRPWGALGLGVMGRALIENNQTADSVTSTALRAATNKEKAPSQAGAYMISMGLRVDVEGAEMLRKKLDYFSVDETRGHAAVALGLMNDRASVEKISEVVLNSAYRPELLKQAAIALGLLGDKKLVPALIDMLSNATGLATQAAISSALGAIGDNRSIDPLVEMLADQQITQTARGFAAVALGIVCDKEPFPWNSKIGVNTNYRANTLTLTGESGTGILDLL